jgi:hypothetical protein
VIETVARGKAKRAEPWPILAGAVGGGAAVLLIIVFVVIIVRRRRVLQQYERTPLLGGQVEYLIIRRRND